MRGADQRRWLTAPLRSRNYRALFNTLRTYEKPVDALRRYLRSSGEYPWRAALRTPLGRYEVLIPHAHDVRTVNEVFCRKDYGSGSPRVVVDVGANIGVSVLYFLTRADDVVVHAWEPVPANLAILRQNLARFSDRVHIHPHAMAPQSGPATFLTESVGRYSGLAKYQTITAGSVPIEVVCDAVDSALREVIAGEGRIDLLKVDTEGSEEAIIGAIAPETWEHIAEVVYEEPGGVVRRPGSFFSTRQ